MPSTMVPGERFAVSPIGAVGGVDRDWAWGGADGAGVRVCVLDSGVEGDHPLVGGLERSMGVADGDDGPVIVPVEPVDAAGHGTACAGVIRSIAPRASISSVRVLGNGKHGTGAALLAGLRWAIDEGYDVINMSLSTTKERFLAELRDLADRAYFRRTVIVASAHNMPVQSYPWPFASVISVASHDGPDPLTFYYNPAPPVEFLARGVRVRVPWSGGREIRTTGNSLATPHIAGVCALILGKHPMLTPFQLRSVLYLTSANVADTAVDTAVDPADTAAPALGGP